MRIIINSSVDDDPLFYVQRVMSEGLSRIEKQANFDNLERYVTLLERANVALSALAELEKNGKLNKISEALK